MKNYTKHFLLGTAILLSSTPVGDFMFNMIYTYGASEVEYTSLLNGFIHSIMIVGILVFGIGLVEMFIEKRR